MYKQIFLIKYNWLEFQYTRLYVICQMFKSWFHLKTIQKNVSIYEIDLVQFSSVTQLCPTLFLCVCVCVRLFTTPWTAARQASLSITNSRSSPKPMFIESVMPSNHLILCRPLLLLPSVFPSIRVFSNESALPIREPKYWSFSFNISDPMNTQDYVDLCGST